MPICHAQGDIFQFGIDKNCDFILVFGHVGMNEMANTWNRFRVGLSTELSAINDPFHDIHGPVLFSPGKWIQFVSERENHGMADEDLKHCINEALGWAARSGLKRLITNGIMDTGHGIDTAHNRSSDDRRVIYINKLLSNHEKEFESITLISLNDAVVRNVTS